MRNLPMRRINPEYAKSGLVFMGLAWAILLLGEFAANPDRFLLPLVRAGLLAVLVIGVLRGSRVASIMLVGWSVVGGLAGVWLALVLMAFGVTLFLWSGGSTTFRTAPSPEQPLS